MFLRLLGAKIMKMQPISIMDFHHFMLFVDKNHGNPWSFSSESPNFVLL